jgi:hypothetical protein
VRVIVVQPKVAKLKRHALHLVAPIIENPAMAGPDDVLLPEEVLGHRVAAAMGFSFTLLQDSLDRSCGRLPESWIVNLKHFYKFLSGTESIAPSVLTGIRYLDENDVRFVFHEELARALAYVQEPVVAWAEKCGVLADESSASASVTAILVAVADAWKRLNGWCKQAGGVPAWLPPEPVSVAAAGSDQGKFCPVIRIGKDGERSVVAPAMEMIPLPRPDASWRLKPAVGAIANRRFAVLPVNSERLLGYGRVNAQGARLALKQKLADEIPPEIVLMILDD